MAPLQQNQLLEIITVKFSSILNILYTNVNSYSPKRHLINHTIEKYEINCALFVESKTKQETNIKYRNWHKIQRNGNITNNNVRGGSLVLTHPSLQMGKSNPPCINNPLNECLHFTIPFLEDHIHIFLVYIHPSSSIEETILTKALQYKYALIIGDFNFSQRKTKQLKNFLRSSNFQKLSTAPTFLMPNNVDSTPDAILYTENLENNIISVEVLPDIGSDHLSLQLKLDLQKNLPAEEEIIKYNFQNCNIEKVNLIMNDYINAAQQETMSPSLIQAFNIKLKQAILNNTPQINKKFYTHELPPYILKLIKTKRRMYREYKDQNNPELKRKINEFNKNIQIMIKQYKEHRWVETCKEINSEQGRNFYQKVNKLTKYKTTTAIPSLEENGNIYETDQEKAQIFKTHFEDAYAMLKDHRFCQTQVNLVNEWYTEYFEENEPSIEEIEEDEYFEMLYAQKNTAPGHDNIPWIVMKKLDNNIHRFILVMYRYCLENGHFPVDWKTGHIITIPKPNTDHSIPSSYRPITLLPVLGKLFEKIIKNRLLSLVKEKIPAFQFGFKEKCSTIHPLTILVSNVQTAKHNNLKSASLFLDIKSAFDSIWHRGLLFKLYELGIPKTLIIIIKNFLENRQLCIRVNSKLSSTFCPEQGVPQGSPLSPLLYNIYCYDIKDTTEASNSAYILQYADDTAFIAHNKNLTATIESLQEQLEHSVTNWFYRWRLLPNPTKSQFLIYNHVPSNTSPTVHIANQVIRPSNSAKYLGVVLDNKLNFNEQTKTVKRKVVGRAKYFRALTYKNEGISNYTAAKIYKTLCRPLIEYGHILYLGCRKPAIKNLQVAERSALRTITKIRNPSNPLHNPSNELLYANTNVQPIEERLNTLSTKFASSEHNRNTMIPLMLTRRNATSRFKYPEHTLLERILSMAVTNP